MKRLILTAAALSFVAPVFARPVNPVPVPSQILKSQQVNAVAPPAEVGTKKNDVNKTIKNNKIVKPLETTKPAKSYGPKKVSAKHMK